MIKSQPVVNSGKFSFVKLDDGDKVAAIASVVKEEDEGEGESPEAKEEKK